MKLILRWRLKKGDRILYQTPRGRQKEFIYGVQTWYRREVPKRIKSYWRKSGKRWYRFRLPTMSEIFSKTYSKRSIIKQLQNNLTAKNPFLEQLRKYGDIKPIEGGPRISESIEVK